MDTFPGSLKRTSFIGVLFSEVQIPELNVDWSLFGGNHAKLLDEITDGTFGAEFDIEAICLARQMHIKMHVPVVTAGCIEPVVDFPCSEIAVVELNFSLERSLRYIGVDGRLDEGL